MCCRPWWASWPGRFTAGPAVASMGAITATATTPAWKTVLLWLEVMRLTESIKLTKIVDVSTAIGRRLLNLSTICGVCSLVAFGVAVLADRLHVALEWEDYADEDEEI